MTELKCPKCNTDMEKIGDFFACPNPHCTMCGDKIVMQYLIDTKKKLDKAIWWLKNPRYTPISTAEKALAEINQKDVK